MGGGSGKLSYEKVDLTGKTAIVTGANGGANIQDQQDKIRNRTASRNIQEGIGYVTCRDLMKMGARVIMACRSSKKAKAALLRLHGDAIDEFGEDTTAHERVEFMKLDLASLKSVMDFVEEFKRKGDPLHLLICNGGLITAKKEMTEDGNETMFQVNYLSHFLLILHLLPVMRQSGEDCRIISVSSVEHSGGSLDLSNIQAEKEFSSSKFYSNSKLFQLMNMYSLHRRLENTNISA